MQVVATADALKRSDIVRFGVALGDAVDFRELRLYVDDDRIFGNNSTEAFLTEVTVGVQASFFSAHSRLRIFCVQSLLRNPNSPADCTTTPLAALVTDSSSTRHSDEKGATRASLSNGGSGGDNCAQALDVLLLVDTTADEAANESNETLHERELDSRRLLVREEIFAALMPPNVDVRLALFEFGDELRLRVPLDSPPASSRTRLFSELNALRATGEPPNYARALYKAIAYLANERRADALGIVLLVGDGRAALASSEDAVERRAVLETIERVRADRNCAT